MSCAAAVVFCGPLRGEPAEPPELLDLQLQQAESGHFYLELEPGRNTLRLHLAGVALRAYLLQAVETGIPRIAFVPLREPATPRRQAWPAGRLDPPRPEMRVEIQPPPANADSTTPPLQLPPRLDEMPVPWTYRLHFGEDLTVVVTSSRAIEQRGSMALFGSLWDKLVEVTRGISQKRPVLRLTLARADAEHLYRALPPDTGLLLLTP